MFTPRRFVSVVAAAAFAAGPLAAVTSASAAPIPVSVSSSVSARHASVPRPSDRLASTALRMARQSTYGGQCKAWVQRVHARAGRGYLRTGYYSGYRHSGYVKVSRARATRGDIVQFYWNSWSSRYGIHTAILLGGVNGGRAKVIDSNWVGHERIGIHTLSISGRLAANPGLRVAFWRYRHR